MPWRRATQFLKELLSGIIGIASFVAGVGCGDCEYFPAS